MTRIAKYLSPAIGLLLMAASPAWSVEIGDPMPEFAVKTFDGGSFSRASLRGKAVLLIFWNTWCPDCMRELPEVNRLAEQFGPRGLTVLAINTAVNDSESKARAYWQKNEFKFSSGFDHYFEIGDAFKVRGVPSIFLFDTQGTARYKQSRLPRDMEERFKQLTE